VNRSGAKTIVPKTICGVVFNRCVAPGCADFLWCLALPGGRLTKGTNYTKSAAQIADFMTLFEDQTDVPRD
jgi:hypothetical protein